MYWPTNFQKLQNEFMEITRRIICFHCSPLLLALPGKFLFNISRKNNFNEGNTGPRFRHQTYESFDRTPKSNPWIALLSLGAARNSVAGVLIGSQLPVSITNKVDVSESQRMKSHRVMCSCRQKLYRVSANRGSLYVSLQHSTVQYSTHMPS